MDISSLLLLALAAVSFGACSTVPTAAERRTIAYEESDHQVFEVYDVANAVIAFGDDSVLNAPLNSIEFSGPLDPCNDPASHCYITGLHVAIPKTGSPSSWRADMIQCRVEGGGPLPVEEPARIFCRASPQSAVEFSYSRRRGIVSYRRICDDCYLGEFRLMGERGLFASGSR